MEAGRKQLVSGEKIAGGRVSAEEALDTMVAKSAAIAVIAGAAGVCHHANPARYTVNLLHAYALLLIGHSAVDRGKGCKSTWVTRGRNENMT